MAWYSVEVDVEQLNPPKWAEQWLRALLRRADRDSVSGDLLEEYRDRIVPMRGRRAADAWYVRQVLGFFWRAVWIWGVLLAAPVLIRYAFDQFDPPPSFYVRSLMTTYSAVACFALAGFVSALRSNSIQGPMVTGLSMMPVWVRLTRSTW